MRTTIWLVGLVLVVGCQRNRARDCAPYAHDPVLDVCVCPEGTRLADGGADCVEYDGGVVLSCPGGAPAVTVYADADGDGHGNPETERMGCPGEAGTSMLADDCDDACASCRPGGSEVCDGKDNDCASGADDTFACVQGTTSTCTTTCSTTGTGACSAECTMPAACTPPSEACNAADDDCDELVDEGVLGFATAPGWDLDDTDFHDVELVPELSSGYVTFAGTDLGLYAFRLDDRGQPVGDASLLVSGKIQAVGASASGERILLAYSIEVTASTHALRVVELDRASLSIVGTATTITTPSGSASPSRVDVSASLSTITYATGGQFHVAQRNIFSGAYMDTVAFSGISSSYDVLFTEGGLGELFVAYSSTPAPVTGDTTDDTELFVQRVISGSADGAPIRLTTNAVPDELPKAAQSGRELAVTWLRFDSDGATAGDVLAARVDTSTRLVSTPLELSRGNFFSVPLIARRGAGWSVLWSDTTTFPTGSPGAIHLAALDGPMTTAGMRSSSIPRAWFPPPGARLMVSPTGRVLAPVIEADEATEMLSAHAVTFGCD